jgi:hypothetical protein
LPWASEGHLEYVILPASNSCATSVVLQASFHKTLQKDIRTNSIQPCSTTDANIELYSPNKILHFSCIFVTGAVPQLNIMSERLRDSFMHCLSWMFQ